ncbi:MAG: hypothetical protein H6826_13550 [Planctomycetes bacterium]|nr:hypothetical protein [Planctomycetota bacterium]
MSRTWSFYDPATGRLVGRTFSGPEAALAINTPPGLAAIEGQHDHVTHRVSLSTGLVEKWREPAPSRDHEWDSTAGAWQLSTAAERRAALAEILAAESLQARALREAVLELLPPGKGQRLREIDDSIATHRAKLQRPVE